MIKEINGWTLNIDDELLAKVMSEYENESILPAKDNIFKVFELVKFSDVNVVILGQDPYPNKIDANGIAFSVDRKDNLPASLRNIFKELDDDLGIKRFHGDLTDVVQQGVLFLNTVLTVKEGKPKSHSKYGWQNTTNQVIRDLSEKGNVIFVLLGNDAQKLKTYINLENNIIIETSHPSPLASYRGFFGSKIFSKINNELVKQGKDPIKW